MKRFAPLLWIVFISTYPTEISYVLNGGRLGDCLINYIKCSFLAYKYNFALLHNPFPHSMEFCFHITDKKYYPHKQPNVQRITSEDGLHNKNHQDKSLILSDYYTKLTSLESPELSDYRGSTDRLFDYAIQNEKFLSRIRSKLQPRITTAPIAIPQNCISIALHVRKGGGFDNPLYSIQRWKNLPVHNPESPLPHKRYHADIDFPTKFPPDQYYIDQLNAIVQAFPNRHLFVFLFTDDPNPHHLAETYKQALQTSKITFGYRTHDNHHTKHIVEDLLNMAYHFDILIRSSSSFSWVAQFIGNHSYAIVPTQGKWYNRHLVMNHIETLYINRANRTIQRYSYTQDNSKKLTEFIRSHQ